MTGLKQCAVGGLLAVAVWLGTGRAHGGDSKPQPLKLRAQLIWGTNDPLPENPKHKEVSDSLKKRLQGVFKWKNYTEVNCQDIAVPHKGTKRVRLSPQCEVEVHDQGDSRVTVRLFGEKKLLVEQRYNPGMKDYLVLGDHDKNKTAWFVVLSKNKD